MTEAERRRTILRKHNIPNHYIDLYLYTIYNDVSFLPEVYFTNKHKTDKTALRHGLAELVILFGNIINNGDI